MKVPQHDPFVFRNYRASFSANDYSTLNSFANQAACRAERPPHTQVPPGPENGGAAQLSRGWYPPQPDLKILQVNHALNAL